MFEEGEKQRGDKSADESDSNREESAEPIPTRVTNNVAVDSNLQEVDMDMSDWDFVLL